jgi:hypothetical protein
MGHEFMAFRNRIIMTAMTLEQLKAENTEEVEVTDDLSPEVEVAEVEAVAEVTEAETNEAGEPVLDETDGELVEAWMQTEGQTSDDAQKKGPSFKGLKQKLRAKANADLEVKDGEIANLKAQLESLQGGQAQTQQPNRAAQLPPRPKRDDFGINDEAYDVAVDKWNDAKFDLKLNGHTQSAQQAQARSAQAQELANSVDQHYESAAKLVAEGKVTEDEYRNADQIVRGTINQVMQGNGDTVSDLLISQLNSAGDGGAKVWFHLGRNDEARETLRNKLAKDPNGLSAMLYLGGLQAKLTAEPAKRVSQAPKPGSRIKGDAKANSDSALLKKYKKAEGDVQARINFKREAKSQGIDTKSW